MTLLRVSTTINATPEEVWADLARIETHVEWMRDAVSLEFTSPQRSGVGTTFDCLTRIGPIRLTDRMEITKWEPTRAMGVRHVGVVEGSGVIGLRRIRFGRSRGATKLTWTEHLKFPWWMGGPVGAVVATPIMWLVWRSSMRTLSARFADA